ISKGAPVVEADVSQNRLLVRGTKNQVAEVQQAVKIIDDNPAMLQGGMRVFTLDKQSGVTLARMLQAMYPKLRDNPIFINESHLEWPNPNHPEARPVPAPTPPAAPPIKENKTDNRPMQPSSRLQVGLQDKPQLVDPSAKQKTDGKKPPVTIVA